MNEAETIRLSEAETRAELIDPALKAAGWGIIEGSRIRREVIAPGRLIGNGKRAQSDIADYVLVYRGEKLAVIEAKKRGLPDTEGLGQAKKYAEKLQTRFAYSTNGIGLYQVDMHTGAEGYVNQYPTPDELWDVTFSEANEWRDSLSETLRDRFAAVPFEDMSGTKEARYYQHNAIKHVLEAIAQGKNRILLTMATGTGKTFIAFQLAWKLFQSRWNLSQKPTLRQGSVTTRRPRILFLSDRNILANQAYNDFSAFPDDALVRIDPEAIKKRGRVPKNGSVFFTIFQTFMTGQDEEGNSTPKFSDYPPDFFDFIIIDECHRGGANNESTWRGILEYFSPAVQLGLTATPKRESNADTYAYFKDPVYTYALKDGINDGFLSPFKVKQIETTLDEYIYSSEDDLDPEWDGEPQEPVVVKKREGVDKYKVSTTDAAKDSIDTPEDRRPQKIKIKLADGKERTFQHQMSSSFWSPDGKPMNAAEFVERLFGEIPELFKDENELRAIWSRPDTRKALLEGLAEKGYGEEQLTEISRLIDAEKSDLYDVLAYIAYASAPMSRRERVLAHKSLIFSRYIGKQQEFLDFVLEQYIKAGVGELDRSKLPQLLELKYHAVRDAVEELGSVANISEVFIGFQQYLYSQDMAA